MTNVEALAREVHLAPSGTNDPAAHEDAWLNARPGPEMAAHGVISALAYLASVYCSGEVPGVTDVELLAIVDMTNQLKTIFANGAGRLEPVPLRKSLHAIQDFVASTGARI